MVVAAAVQGITPLVPSLDNITDPPPPATEFLTLSSSSPTRQSGKEGYASHSSLCVSHRVSAKDCMKISIAQASALAYYLLEQHTELVETDIESGDYTLSAAPGAVAVVIALHCCKGLFDSTNGPVVVLVGSQPACRIGAGGYSSKGVVEGNTQPYTIPNQRSVTLEGIGGSKSRSIRVPDAGVWVLVLTFRDLQQWGQFAGVDREPYESIARRLAHIKSIH